ncbi:NERD domain-containing protein [Nocardia sp. SYP-A9097]|uniref:NERD domain-containing protein n=1 Tax=Nocardia sp. SYP-A9097 TaxID=2663237 RepID=UPI00129A61FC|nr:NERD domain-containing protein [Nocardia sp. SYP-A9097]MRH88285.1 NERD domain-containing protein [Nocardia sp. SYP-A9097]
MLVRVQNPAATHAEKVLIDWLRTWKGSGDPKGVATVNCSLFHGDRLYPFDAVIWTPTSCVVIEAESLVERMEGELEVPLNGPWRVGDKLINFEGNDKRTPLDKSRDHTFALQNWLAERGLGQRVVHGAVLVVPSPDSNLRVTQLWSDPSFEVLVGSDPRRLHEYFTNLSSRGRPQWSANDVAWGFRGLGILPYLPAPQDLLNEGFLGPVDITLWHGGPQQAQAEAYAEEQAQLEADAAAAGSAFRVPTPWFAPTKLYPREHGDIDFGRGFMRIMLTLGMIVAVLWVLWVIIAGVVAYG